MSKVYVFGPILLFGEDYLPFYKQMVKLCKRYFDDVICTYPDFWNSKETPKQFYKRTYDTITDSDLFICEASSPSSGAGMELEMAAEHGIPVIAFAKQKMKVSSMVLGLPVLKKLVHYKNMPDLLKKAESEIKKYKEE